MQPNINGPDELSALSLSLSLYDSLWLVQLLCHAPRRSIQKLLNCCRSCVSLPPCFSSFFICLRFFVCVFSFGFFLSFLLSFIRFFLSRPIKVEIPKRETGRGTSPLNRAFVCPYVCDSVFHYAAIMLCTH